MTDLAHNKIRVDLFADIKIYILAIAQSEVDNCRFIDKTSGFVASARAVPPRAEDLHRIGSKARTLLFRKIERGALKVSLILLHRLESIDFPGHYAESRARPAHFIFHRAMPRHHPFA
jgi:hypothetical protein